MDFIRKTISPWEKRYGQIRFGTENYEIALQLFSDYFGKTFKLNTFKGLFSNRNFLHEQDRRDIRLSCRSFFGQLNEGDVIYLKPIDIETIGVFEEEPLTNVEEITEDQQIINTVGQAQENVQRILIKLLEENFKLREDNQFLLNYKERFERYQSLDTIFDDEKFMEDWLERNIHRANQHLKVIDRQIYASWNERFMYNKLDLFCIDQTTKELVIVENKIRGRDRRIETQYMTYTTWVRRNLDQINEKYNEEFDLCATENFKFMIISDTIDERLESICEEFHIALILIDGGVIIEEIIPYSSN